VWILAVVGIVTSSLFGIGARFYAAESARATWGEVDVVTERCDCIIKFYPSPAINNGAGTPDDPYVVDNSGVSFRVGVNGSGLITIVDENGDVLFSFNKTTSGYEEIYASLNLPDEVGGHWLKVLIDGEERWGDEVSVLYFDFQGLGEWIDVPSTGYVYMFGYAVGTTNIFMTVVAAAVLAGSGWFMFGFLRRRRE
jgi:hypothetical protein